MAKQNKQNNEALLRTYLAVNRLYTACVNTRIDTLSIHRSQYQMLSVIAQNPDIRSQNIIARALGISPAAVAFTLKRLENDGYITRESDAKDNRANRILLTEKGNEMISDAKAELSKVDRAMLSSLTPEQLSVFADCLKTMQINLARLNQIGLLPEGSENE